MLRLFVLCCYRFCPLCAKQFLFVLQFCLVFVVVCPICFALLFCLCCSFVMFVLQLLSCWYCSCPACVVPLNFVLEFCPICVAAFVLSVLQFCPAYVVVCVAFFCPVNIAVLSCLSCNFCPVSCIFVLFVLQFLSHDIPLFEGIISDLFPGVELPSPDYACLEEALREKIALANLQCVPWFMTKIIQVGFVMSA